MNLEQKVHYLTNERECLFQLYIGEKGIPGNSGLKGVKGDLGENGKICLTC